MSVQSQKKGVTLKTLRTLKGKGEKIACLTAYDASFGALLDEMGIDVILIGDSLGMVVQGRDSTVTVTMQDMLYHCRCVAATCRSAFLIGDMPFMSYSNVGIALKNATRMVQEGGVHMVKLEASTRQVQIIEELSACGIPVCAHLGLRPQHIHKIGGFSVQANGEFDARALLESAHSLEQAGADMLLLECVPAPLATEITQQVKIPVIGIGAGKGCDGQILVLYDVLGISHGTIPKFAHNFLRDATDIQDAIRKYIKAVKSNHFPVD